ncbi:MAG: hypothetical protein ABIJ75_03535 [Actinomycetota bacterium]
MNKDKVFDRLQRLVELADLLHEQVALTELADTPTWLELGDLLDEINPLSFKRNTGDGGGV